MNATNQQLARARTEILVELRKQHGDEVKRAQEFLKEQQSVRKKLRFAMKGSPCSVPQLSKLTGIAAGQVLWHIAAMKKYGSVVEAGMDATGDYYQYGLSKGAQA